MSNNKGATPLSVMLGSGEDFSFDITELKTDENGEPVFDTSGNPVLKIALSKVLKVIPLTLKETHEFTEERINIGAQMFTALNDKDKAKTDKWLKTHVFLPGAGKPVTVDLLKEEGLNLLQLRKLIGKMLDISG